MAYISLGRGSHCASSLELDEYVREGKHQDYADYSDILGNGFGRHYWNIDTTKVVILLKVEYVFWLRIVAKIKQTFYVAEILYLLTVTLVKASYLMFYVIPSLIFWRQY